MLESISLKLGFMSNEEIINWAQISSNYFLRIRKSWCEKQLSKYAKYNLVKGGVEILEIIKPVYASNAKKEVEKNFSKCWGHDGYQIDTCKNACRKMQEILNNKTNIADITIYNHICLTKRELYGVVNKYEGSIGESRWIFCKKIDGEHYPFTEEEEEIKKKLADKYLCNDKDKIITMKGLKSAYANGEITLDEYNEGIDELIDNEMGWIAFQEAFEKAIGCEVTFATLLIDNGIKIHANQRYDF